jgi:hypothetical protein
MNWYGYMCVTNNTPLDTRISEKPVQFSRLMPWAEEVMAFRVALELFVWHNTFRLAEDVKGPDPYP